MDTVTLHRIAERVRRGTSNADLVTLCDAVLAMSEHTPSIRAAVGDCVVCAERREQTKLRVKRHRAKVDAGSGT